MATNLWSDSKARNKVLTNAALTAVGGSLLGATAAIITRKPVKSWAFNTGANFGIFGLTFFSLRHSLMTIQREKNVPLDLKDGVTRDVDELYSSILAGAAAGGVFAAMTRGQSAMLSGATTFGLLCGVGQFAYTKVYRYRQQLILEARNTAPIDVEAEQTVVENKPIMERVIDYLTEVEWSPLKKLSNDEYREILKEKLVVLDTELADLDRMIAESEAKSREILGQNAA
ncbi:hypothetical protein K493DRAFT_317838 [Basidiobolus meristosporus CBS 931.73]|uniref:Tim17-domain-containing protein n=1 Tax=Basidiobolus meristosporus CBS 931.73 TaxID=1314790 RepID=A0A1Y1XYU1_9FUNG|nr:hypothetical protein K493DRAFT_317838 [Basidiobolus meristosporus CBS 931.73]|eukprot:ORX90656.1 hypothetical protein K493DRAFT_317838 [Basidiobolus meristosporus CBS 931.73]